MTNNTPPIGEAATPQPVRPRRHLRLAAIGGIAAIAILGGGITAVATAPPPTSSTSTVGSADQRCDAADQWACRARHGNETGATDTKATPGRRRHLGVRLHRADQGP